MRSLWLYLQEQILQTIQPKNRTPAIEESKDNLDVNKKINLRNLHIHLMDEFVGTATELRGLFKIHASKTADENFQQLICHTAKEWFDKAV